MAHKDNRFSINGYFPYIVTLLNDAVLNILVFTTARGLAEREANLLVMGVFGALFSLAFAFSSIYFGRWSDRIDRKKQFMYLGTTILLICTAAMRILPSGGVGAFISYGIAGASAGIIYPAILAWLNLNTVPKRGQIGSRRVSGIVIKFCISWNLGMIFGNYTAGRLYNVLPGAQLYVGVIMCAVNLLLIYYMSAAKVAVSGDNYTSQYECTSGREINPERKQLFILLSWVGNIGGAFVGSLILHLFPKLAVGIGIPPEQHAIILGIMRAAVIIVYFILYASSFWHYRFTVIMTVQFIAIAGLLLLYATVHVGVIVLALVCIGCLTGHNYFAGMYYGNSVSDASNCGKLNGYHEGTIGIGVGVGSLGGGAVGMLFSVKTPYLVGIIVLGIVIIIQISLYIRFLKRGGKAMQATGETGTSR